MRILAFETSAKAASVALLEGDALLGELYLNCGLTHSRTLLESAQRLLEITELTAKDIDAVACAALAPNYLRLSQAERERAERLRTSKESVNG